MEDMDGISNSPEPIQHHILSFLSFKHVVKTSVLSKTWAQVWRRFPFLVFDSTFFNQIPWKCIMYQWTRSSIDGSGVMEGIQLHRRNSSQLTEGEG